MPIPANEQIGTLFGAAIQKVGVLPVANGGTDDLFTVATGKVQLVSLLGEVTSADITGTAGTILIRLRLDPTGALGVTPICDQIDVKGDTIGQMYTITGGVGVAMVVTATAGLAVPSFGTNEQVLLPGVIILDLEETAVITGDVVGEVTWTVVYYPLDLGAYIEAAA